MIRWILDSNFFIEAVAEDPTAMRGLRQAIDCDWCGYSLITRVEVLGFPRLTPANEQSFSQLLRHFTEVPINEIVVAEAIRIRRLIRIKTPDAIIAASALLNDAELVTRNVTDFQRVLGLRIRDSGSF